ncbi:hypothetical protein F5878DRAFT_646791 [Lentinula raphanica]|uniref:Uncharacterized protein n=1 Tax=Lentinula raphanica TaxID=153919 RepID=A0AA38U570_9AGAR|nr:hypothetical protein F5878DRAFT_646791 [Lentinula raphanica]
MSGNQPVKGRHKFNVSLATLTLPGVQYHHFKTFKHPDIVPERPRESETESEVLTPQQAARKRYEERNIVQRREKARERMAKIAKENGKDKEYMKRNIVKVSTDIEMNVVTRKTGVVPSEFVILMSGRRYIENFGAKSFHHYLRRRNGHLQRPDDYVKS